MIGTACSTVGCRYVGQRPGRYPQDTAESFVKWSSAGLLHSPAVELNGGKGDQWISRTKPFVQGWTHTHVYIFDTVICFAMIPEIPMHDLITGLRQRLF